MVSSKDFKSLLQSKNRRTYPYMDIIAYDTAGSKWFAFYCQVDHDLILHKLFPLSYSMCKYNKVKGKIQGRQVVALMGKVLYLY